MDQPVDQLLPSPQPDIDHGVEEEDDEEREEEVETGGDDGVLDPGIPLPVDVAEKGVLQHGEVPEIRGRFFILFWGF